MVKLVKKFGGTSLQTKERMDLAVEEVIGSLDNGDYVTTVVSAMGREGDPYATDSLIGLLKEVSKDVNPLTQDLLISCGEVMSASLFAHYLDSRGYPAIPMTGFQAGILTTDDFGDARIIDIDPVRIERFLSTGKSVVLAGFQGNTVRNEVTTLGRGGSDTTAVAVAGKLGADLVEIYSDVPGVAVVDPAFVSDPPFFTRVSRSSLLTLAKHGTKVIHPRAVESARKYDMELSIKCAWNRNNETIVGRESSCAQTPLGIAVHDSCRGVVGSPDELNNIRFSDEIEGRFHGNDGRDIVLTADDFKVNNQVDIEVRDDLSMVTAVFTHLHDTEDVRNRIVDEISPERYLYRRNLENGVQFLLDSENPREFVRSLYDLFY